jgi:hypothetical protein
MMSRDRKKRHNKIDALTQENLRLVTQIRELNGTVANYQFFLACIIHQSGGKVIVPDSIMNDIREQAGIEFKEEYDEERKATIIRTAVNEQLTKEMVEKIEIGA